MQRKYKEILNIIKEAERYGIVRDPNTYSFITQYPPPLTLNEVPDPLLQILQANVWSLEENLHIYDHNPYCTGRCKSCTFDTIPNPTDEDITRIQKAKRKEFDIYHRYSKLAERVVCSIYFGGGTPTFPEAHYIGDQLDYYRNHLNLDKNCEISVEISPETIINKNKPKQLVSYGFNRASIGFQELDDTILKALGRRHNSKQAIEAYENLKNSGFKKINIDLMYGLMGQNLNGWINTVKKVLALKPDYITIYNFRREGLTEKDYKFPSKKETFLMYLEALGTITSAGYNQIAPDQFALSEKEFKYQTEKWYKGNEFLGLGNRAYSYFNGWVYYNFNLDDYINSIYSGYSSIWIGKELATEAQNKITYFYHEESIRRTIIFGLKTSGINNPNSGINLKLFEDRFGFTLFETPIIWEHLKELRNLGLLEINPEHTKLALPGLVIAEEICRELYSDEVKNKLNKIGDKFGRGGL